MRRAQPAGSNGGAGGALRIHTVRPRPRTPSPHTHTHIHTTTQALEGVIQDGVGLGYPSFFGLPAASALDADATWGRFVRGGRVHLRCEVLECE